MVLTLAGAVAQADVEGARRAYAKGMTAYNLQRFAEALALFQRAYEEKQDPAFLFNLAQCQRQLGQYDTAAKSYRAYLNSSPQTPANAEQVRVLIGEMETAAQRKVASELPLVTPTPTPVVTTPTPVVTTPATTSVDHAWYRNPVGWTLVGVGVAGLGVSIGLLVHGNDLDHQLGSATSLTQVQQLQSDRDTFRTAGFALVGVGAAAAVAGAVVLALTARQHHGRTAWQAPAVTNGSAALAFGGAL